MAVSSLERSLWWKSGEGLGEDTSEVNRHSLRIGAASTAAASGMEDSLMKTLGRWESDAYQRYIKIHRKELATYTSMIAE